MTNLGTLNERLQYKLQQDKIAIEAQTKAELQSLSDSLSRLSQNALDTIEVAMDAKNAALIRSYGEMTNRLHSENRRLQKTLLRSWLRNLLIGSGILVGLAVGTWGFSARLSNRITTLQTSIAGMEKHENLLRHTITELEKKTNGIVLMDTKDGRFLVLPQGMTIKSGWKIGTLPAWKLE